MEIWAHRGWSGAYPENTLPAFEAAMALGVTGIECDVRLAADGVPVVIHDDRVDRTTDGTGKVARFTSVEIQRLDAGQWFHPRFAGARVPTLAQVLDVIGQHAAPVRLNVELKSVRWRRRELVRRVWAEICQRGCQDRVLVSSFDAGLLRLLRTAAPDARLALVCNRWGRLVARAARRLRVSAVHVSADEVTSAVVRQIHDAGWVLRVFTVNHLDVARRLSAVGVDGIFTDHPDAFLGIKFP